MSEIKYKTVFGVHEFKNDWCDIAIKTFMGGVFEAKLVEPLILPEGSYICAMRRIIKAPAAPVWTKKDRESEILPELGSLIVGESSGLVYEVIKVTKSGVVIFADTPDDIVGYYDKRDILLFFKPIETPEERSQRLEDEWVNKAWGETAVFAGVTQEEHDRLRVHLRHIYRAQLSGELQVPKGE